MLDISMIFGNFISLITDIWYLFPFILLIAYLKKSKPKKRYKTKKYQKYTNVEKKTQKKQLSRKEKKQKGDDFERHVSNYFKNKGYISWEHGLEKAYQDGGIDLIIKKNKSFLLIQCKNWEKYKMNKELIVKYEQQAKEFLLKNKELGEIVNTLEYNVKMVFVTSKDTYTKEAREYILENNKFLDYMVIPHR